MYIIDRFEGEHAFLSNFYEAHQYLNGITYPTNEHYYQAMKAINPVDHAVIVHAVSASDAKKLGKKVKCRVDWEHVKIAVMLQGLQAKFTQNKELREQLMQTYPAILIEGNWWKDDFWGICTPDGQNWLGRLLMMVRSQLFF